MVLRHPHLFELNFCLQEKVLLIVVGSLGSRVPNILFLFLKIHWIVLIWVGLCYLFFCENSRACRIYLSDSIGHVFFLKSFLYLHNRRNLLRG